MEHLQAGFGHVVPPPLILQNQGQIVRFAAFGPPACYPRPGLMRLAFMKAIGYFTPTWNSDQKGPGRGLWLLSTGRL